MLGVPTSKHEVPTLMLEVLTSSDEVPIPVFDHNFMRCALTFYRSKANPEFRLRMKHWELDTPYFLHKICCKVQFGTFHSYVDTHRARAWRKDFGFHLVAFRCDTFRLMEGLSLWLAIFFCAGDACKPLATRVLFLPV